MKNKCNIKNLNKLNFLDYGFFNNIIKINYYFLNEILIKVFKKEKNTVKVKFKIYQKSY